MLAVSLYISIFVLVISVSAATLCLAYYGAFRHQSAFWLAMCMAGVTWFAMAAVTFQLSASPLNAAVFLGPLGLRLIWQALGGIFVAHSLPRFLLSAFGAPPRARIHRLLDVATLAVAILSVIRVVTGWRTLSSVAVVPNTILRIILYVLVGGALAFTLAFQSRLPDRSLYKTVIVQIGTSALLVPLVILEDVGLFRIPGLPYLSGQVLLVATSTYAILHASRSLKRPKYVADFKPSPYFVDHFGISERELDVVSGVLGGLSNNEIAERLFISPRTVEKHLYNVYQKAGIKNRLQLFNLLRSDTR